MQINYFDLKNIYVYKNSDMQNMEQPSAAYLQ